MNLMEAPLLTAPAWWGKQPNLFWFLARISGTMGIPIPRAGSLQPKATCGSSGLAEELNPNQLWEICRVFPESGCGWGWNPSWLGESGSGGANGPGKIPGNAGAVPQDDAEKTRGCSGKGLDLTWEGIFLLFLLRSGKMSWCAHFSVRVK